MNRDRYDLPLTTASDRAAAFYRDGVDCMLSAWYGGDVAFDRAIAEDPGFALPYVARARIHQMNMEIPEARAKAAQARQLAAAASPRERRHVEIIAATIEGQPKAALIRRRAASRGISARRADPVAAARRVRPLCVLRPGRPRRRKTRDLPASRRHYGEDWWFLSYLGWSHTEAGDASIGRALTERAFPLRPANANAAHGLSHALFEQGEAETGREFCPAG